ncbi:MAG: DNRLRE domain-containing protein [Phycisphaerales bacterium]|nr:DNRLRE domain-containing protein [Phycisphaerales bacterium]
MTSQPTNHRRPVAGQRRSHPLTVCMAAIAALTTGGVAIGDSVVLVTDRDNTLIQDQFTNLSLGIGPYMFAGRVGPNGEGMLRRAVMRFDIASAVPAGSTITAASLKLWMAGTNSGNQTMVLRRLTRDWGEGNSFAFGGLGAPAEEGDATWQHTFYPTEFWDAPGGDFVSVVSATKTVGGVNFYTWGSTAQMVLDVQSWLDNSTANFGWILTGNESALQTVKKFSTREDELEANRPRLTITFTPPPPPNPADLNNDGVVDGADLGLLLAAWNTPGPGDLDNNGVVDGADLGLLLAAWS